MKIELFLPWREEPARRAPVRLKQFEDAAPAHDARMNKDACVRKHAVANVSWIPGFARSVDGHIYHHGRADNIGAWHEAPVAAVIGIIAIVTHHEIFFGGHGH